MVDPSIKATRSRANPLVSAICTINVSFACSGQTIDKGPLANGLHYSGSQAFRMRGSSPKAAPNRDQSLSCSYSGPETNNRFIFYILDFILNNISSAAPNMYQAIIRANVH